jgi:hypothetical protein
MPKMGILSMIILLLLLTTALVAAIPNPNGCAPGTGQPGGVYL